MAMPIVAGPGSISTVIVYSARAGTTLDYMGLAVVLALVMLLVLGIFLASRRVQRAVGETNLEIVTRIFGLVLAGIAIQFIAEGLGDLFRPGSRRIRCSGTTVRAEHGADRGSHRSGGRAIMKP